MMQDLIKRSVVRWFVLGLFMFNLVTLAVGLQLVKSYASSQASKKASAVALATRANDRYNINRTTCSLRALVEPQIKADQKTLASYIQAAADKTAKPDARVRNQQRVRDTKQKISGEYAYLAAYATIPPDFDCSTLPKRPPKVTDG